MHTHTRVPGMAVLVIAGNLYVPVVATTTTYELLPCFLESFPLV